MWKVIVASMAFVLIVGSGATAGIIIQDQGMSIGTVNGIHLLQGQQDASSSQTLIVSVTQDGGGTGSMFAIAHLVGIDSQLGGFSTMTGLLHVGGLSMGSPLMSSNATLRDMSDLDRLHMLMLSAN